MLYLVPTPIGHLEDITLRALETLRTVDVILAEDTRVTKKLLNRYEITTPVRSFHSHNEHRKLDIVIQDLKSGEQIALVSDAGSPGISDPGFLLVREAIQNDIKVEALPGPSALIPAIISSGLPSDRFHFEGFLPQKKGRQKRLDYLMELTDTIILYESPYRVVKTLSQVIDRGEGERSAAVCRELTKMHEEVARGTVAELHKDFSTRQNIKGEIVMVIEGKPKKK